MVEARILDGGAGSCVLYVWLAVWEEDEVGLEGEWWRWTWALHSDGVEQIIEHYSYALKHS